MDQALSLQTTIHPSVIQQKGFVLKKLKQKHKTMVALHLQGLKRDQIAQLAGCVPEYVSMIIAQPIVQEYLRDLEQYMDNRLRSLYGKSVDAIDSVLTSGSDDAKLKAARLQMEATDKMGKQEHGKQTAEDVVSAILAGIQVNVNVNTGDTHGNSFGSTILPSSPMQSDSED